MIIAFWMGAKSCEIKRKWWINGWMGGHGQIPGNRVYMEGM